MRIDTNGFCIRFSQMPTPLKAKNEDYDLLSENLIQMDISFQRKSDGVLVRQMPEGLQGSVQLTNIALVVVTLAMVDSETMANKNPSHIKMLSEKLTRAPEGILTFSHWSTNLNTEIRSSDKNSPEIARKTMLFQRFYRISSSH